uniref:Nitronate monooxygenase domain-containing protein n=1 Tax=Desulfobacca acetoxidans TaxID=60893 RepID=A0A7V4LCT7_9BACT
MVEHLPEMARATGTVALFDLSRTSPGIHAGACGALKVRQVLISPEAFLAEELEEFIRVSGVDALWVEYHPALIPGGVSRFLSRARSLADRCRVVPVTGDLEFLLSPHLTGEACEIVALKGSEAAGLGSPETLGLLYALLEEHFAGRPQAPGLVLYGGLATPEAAAAFFLTGARGLIFESLHWQTDLVTATEETKSRLARLTPEDTTVVGGLLGAPLRVFDRGNSLAVRELRELAGTLSGEDSPPEGARRFLLAARERAVHPLESTLGREELVFLGPEAALAESFARRYGRNTHKAIVAFQAEIQRLLNRGDEVRGQFLDSPAARDLGVKYPFIQGAMTWISDVPAFAREVAAAGALPTLALGLRTREDLRREWGDLHHLLAGRPYAVNVLALPENPHLEEQLAWVAENRPPLTVIAAGDPGVAQRLLGQNLRVMYIAPTTGLLRLALEMGVPWVALEGREAGGHVAAHSTLTLAQLALDLKRREPWLFHHRRLVLAGGSVAELDERIEQSRRGRPLWPYLLAVVLIVLAIEAKIANRNRPAAESSLRPALGR